MDVKFGIQYNLVQIGANYGADYLLNLAQEECAELIQAISKLTRFLQANEYQNKEADLKTHLYEEIADVEICIQMLKNRYKCDESVQNWKRKKVERWQKRIENMEVQNARK